MKYLLPIAVCMLMISVGMSLRGTQIVANWRRLTVAVWIKLVLSTFLLPPLLALALGQIFPIPLAATAGLFLVAVAPGAPLMTRGMAKRGFDLHMAASYQVWGALLSPLFIPLLVAGAASLYGRDVWISPLQLLTLIAEQQFIPLLAGVTLMYFAPHFSTRVCRIFNVAGNAILTIAIVAMLYKMGPLLMTISPWVAVAALLLAGGCLGLSRLLLPGKTNVARTLAVSNTNRHVGLALLLSGQSMHDQRTLAAVATYALAAPLIMWLYTKFAPPDPKETV